MSLKKNLDITMGNKYECAILNFWFCSNYGALLTCYALQELLVGMGKSTRVINYIPPRTLKHFKNSLSERFAARYLKLTELCRNKAELQRLNERAEVFLAGSDQIWRHAYFSRNGGHIFQLNFVRSGKKKIACAASFGTDHFEGDVDDTMLMKFYLQQFDSISVREEDGVRICRDSFGVGATHVLDPVFLIPSSAWDGIIDNSARTEKHFIAFYVLDQCASSNSMLSAVKRHFPGAPMVEMGPGSSKKGEKISVEDWLYYVKNCDFFVTDSFHGTCFAIIFNKPFICLFNSSKGNSRFSSLLRTFGLTERGLQAKHSNLSTILSTDIDYGKVNHILEQEAARSRQWLTDSLEAPPRADNAAYDIIDSLLTAQEMRKNRFRWLSFIRRLLSRIRKKK